MSALRQPKTIIADALDRMDDDESAASFLRLAVAIYVATMLTLGALIANFTKKAATQAFSLAKTLAVLVVVFLLYRAMVQFASGIVTAAVNGVITQLTNSGEVSERVANAIGVVVACAVLYGLYRVAVWSIQPALDKLDLPDPSQTSVTDYISDPDDVPDGSMAEDILSDTDD